jgi:hypothetical protein
MRSMILVTWLPCLDHRQDLGLCLRAVILYRHRMGPQEAIIGLRMGARQSARLVAGASTDIEGAALK